MTTPHDILTASCYTLSSFRRRLHANDTFRDVEIAAGGAHWLPAQRHYGETIGDTNTHVISSNSSTPMSRARRLRSDRSSRPSWSSRTATGAMIPTSVLAAPSGRTRVSPSAACRAPSWKRYSIGARDYVGSESYTEEGSDVMRVVPVWLRWVSVLFGLASVPFLWIAVIDAPTATQMTQPSGMVETSSSARSSASRTRSSASRSRCCRQSGRHSSRVRPSPAGEPGEGIHPNISGATEQCAHFASYRPGQRRCVKSPRVRSSRRGGTRRPRCGRVPGPCLGPAPR